MVLEVLQGGESFVVVLGNSIFFLSEFFGGLAFIFGGVKQFSSPLFDSGGLGFFFNQKLVDAVTSAVTGMGVIAILFFLITL